MNRDAWLNLGEGATLQLVLDGEPVSLEGPGSAGERYTGEDGMVYEVALYETSGDFIRKVAGAGKVEVHATGDFEIDRHFGPVNRLYFQQFVVKYIDAQP